MRKKKKRKTKGGPPKPKADNDTFNARVQVILQLKLDGAQRWDMMQHVAEKEQTGESPWMMDEDRKPLCERQIDNYIALASKQIAEIHKARDEHAVAIGFARREGLYALAKQAKQYHTALAVLQDISALAGEYPGPKKQPIELTGKNGDPIETTVTVIDTRKKILSFAAEFRAAALQTLAEAAEKNGDGPTNGDDLHEEAT